MNKRGSLFHISKRDTLPLPKALAIRGGIILLALVFCGLITTLLPAKAGSRGRTWPSCWASPWP